MGRKNRRSVGPNDSKAWKKSSDGKWELVSKRDKKLNHEKESLRKP